MTGTRIVIAGVLILLAMICLSGCISPQEDNPDSAMGSEKGGKTGNRAGVGTTPTQTPESGGSGLTPTASPTPGEAGYLTPATPFPVATTPTSGLSGHRIPDENITPTEYISVYYGNIACRNNKTAFTYNLVRPPLVIEMCFSPNMTSRTIWYDSKYENVGERTETVTSISPYAWFEVIVRDPVSGQVIAQEGFSRGYSVDTGKDLTIRSQGKYLIEFSGNELSAQIQMKVPKEGNPAGSPLRTMSCSF
jgi:hypothetical protein